MNLADLSREDWAQIAIAVKKQNKGKYTQLVESIDTRLKNIERMVAKLVSDKPPKK